MLKVLLWLILFVLCWPVALLASPYFYLLPNDALYVEPLAARTQRANAGNLALIFSGISAIVLILNYIKLTN